MRPPAFWACAPTGRNRRWQRRYRVRGSGSTRGSSWLVGDSIARIALLRWRGAQDWLAGVSHRVAERPHTLDRNSDCIARLQRAHSRRSSRCDHVAGFQRHDLRDVAHHHIERKDEIGGRAILTEFAVDPGLHSHPSPVNEPGDHHGTDRTKRVEAFGARPLAVFVLQVAGGDVVDTGISENELPHVVAFAKAAAAFADDHTELAFVVHAL